MKKRYIVGILVLLCVFLALGCSGNGTNNSSSTTNQAVNSTQPSQPSTQPLDDTPALTITNSQITKDAADTYEVKGTAIANKDLSYAEVDAKFTDASGAVVGTGAYMANINNLKKGESWKFVIYGPYDDGTGTMHVENYNLTVGSCL